MKLVLDLDDLEYDKLIEYYHIRPRNQQSLSVEAVAKRLFLFGIDINLVHARQRALTRPGLTVKE